MGLIKRMSIYLGLCNAKLATNSAIQSKTSDRMASSVSDAVSKVTMQRRVTLDITLDAQFTAKAIMMPPIKYAPGIKPHKLP